MPFAIPQAQLYGARGRMADGASVRNRGQEQFNTTSGNPGMPIFNTQPSPQQGNQQTYNGQPTSLGYSTNMAPQGGVSNAQAAQANIQPGGTNNFQQGVMPQFNNWNGGGFVRGGSAGRMPPVNTQPSPNGGPRQQGGYGTGQGPSAWQQAHDNQMANDPQYAAAVQRASQQRAAWYAAHGQVTNSTQPAPVTLPIMSNS